MASERGFICLPRKSFHLKKPDRVIAGGCGDALLHRALQPRPKVTPAANETTTRKPVRHCPESSAVLDANCAAPLARLAMEAVRAMPKAAKVSRSRVIKKMTSKSLFITFIMLPCYCTAQYVLAHVTSHKVRH